MKYNWYFSQLFAAITDRTMQKLFVNPSKKVVKKNKEKKRKTIVQLFVLLANPKTLCF